MGRSLFSADLSSLVMSSVATPSTGDLLPYDTWWLPGCFVLLSSVSSHFSSVLIVHWLREAVCHEVCSAG